jgi:hypothetical protein
MGELDDRLHAHHRRKTLERVQRAKQFAHLALVRLVRSQRSFDQQQVRIRGAHVLLGFRQVSGDELLPIERYRHAEACASSSKDTTCATISAGSNGLVMKREAPTWSARVRESSSPRVVTTMIGRARKVS